MEKLKINPKDLRIANGLTQKQFWEKLGITQSGGSRYENGERRIPPSLEHILRIVYIEGIDLTDVTRERIRVAKLLKSEHPELHAALLKKLK